MEIWKEIIWYEWIYFISSTGIVKNSRWMILVFTKHNLWYLLVWLCSKWKKKLFLVHRLVAQHFIENTENKPEVNHKDWNKQNNNDWNLEWCTKSENQLHRHRILLRTNSKICYQFDKNWNFINEFQSVLQAEEKTWVNWRWIYLCCIWKRIVSWWYIWSYNKSLPYK